MNKSKILYLFTRTPLHVGAGASVGAIDQPVVRERHTGFPIIPASSLKGTFADAWNDSLIDEKYENGAAKRVRVTKEGNASDAAWLFGSDTDKHPAAGALQFSEARLLAFPIRSAKGSFAWITSPLLLRRAARDGVLAEDLIKPLKTPADEQAVYDDGVASPLDLSGKLVLEEYTFNHSGTIPPGLSSRLAKLIEDPVWKEISARLAVLSDGMMSFFAKNACEIAQHVRISDETGTAEGGALFNQENVPSETLFYAVMQFFAGRGEKFGEKTPSDAIQAFSVKLLGERFFQFGGDASTGLGYCTVELDGGKEA